MSSKRFFTDLGGFLAVCIAVTGLMASEHHGIVKSSGLPVPGATVTATQGDKKVVTTTDEHGAYAFPELADGVWTISVEMLGFGKLSRDVGVAPDAPTPEWDLKILSLEAITAPPAAHAAAAPAPATPPAAAAGTTAAAEKPAATPASTAPATVPAPNNAAAAKGPAALAKAALAKKATASAKAKGGQGSATQNASAAANGRPSLRQAMAQQQSGFQRVGMNQAEGGSGSGRGGS